MKIAVLGLGYVGFTTACCLASQGHQVVGVDVDMHRVDSLNMGVPPFQEPGLASLLVRTHAVDRISATTVMGEALVDAELAIICVGTPSAASGAHDMSQIMAVTDAVAEAVAHQSGPPLTVCYRSTMAPGSMRTLVATSFRSVLGRSWRDKVELVYHPEFLREAQAIDDHFNPPKIVIGTWDSQPCARLAELYSEFSAPIFVTNFEEAEIIKFVDNSWHANKVAFANEMGRLCHSLNIDADIVHRIFVADTKLNISAAYTKPGGAFGGSCLAKDVQAFRHLAKRANVEVPLLDSLLPSNAAHTHHHFDQIRRRVPKGGKVLLAGLAFKAQTDDLRESPNLAIAVKLFEQGFQLRVFDPELSCAVKPSAVAELPELEELLISRDEANGAVWDLVVVNNETAAGLNLEDKIILATDKM